MNKEWTLRELAAETGIPERTIRFYISRGLLDPPLRGGRGAVYGEKHKARLLEIRHLQSKGMMLAEIGHALAVVRSQEKAGPVLRSPNSTPSPMAWFERDGTLDESSIIAMEVDPAGGPARALPEAETWRTYRVAPDVLVSLKSGSGPWRTKRLLAAVHRFAAEVMEGTNKEDIDE